MRSEITLSPAGEQIEQRGGLHGIGQDGQRQQLDGVEASHACAVKILATRRAEPTVLADHGTALIADKPPFFGDVRPLATQLHDERALKGFDEGRWRGGVWRLLIWHGGYC